MTQRLSTKIGIEGGLETNVETGGSRGFQIADNVIYRPVGGLSKTVGSKKLSEGLENFERKIIATAASRDGSVLSLVENDSGSSEVLGYATDGLRVDLYATQSSPRVVLNPDQTFSGNTKIRLEFPQNVFQEDFSFIQTGFNNLSLLDGFFETQTDFVNVSVRQDSVNPDRLRFNFGFALFPLKNAEIILTGSSGFMTPPTLGEYDIYAVNSNFTANEIILSGSTASPFFPSGSGTISFSLKTTKVITLSENANSGSPNSLVGTDTRVFFETQGQLPTSFSTSMIQLPQPTVLGDENVFPGNEGQFWFSDEDPFAPKVSHYGVPRGIDVVAFSKPAFNDVTAGALEPDRLFGYCALFKKKIDERELIGAPSPTFFHSTRAETLTNYTSIALDVDGFVFNAAPLLPSLLGNEIFIEFEAPLATPPITTPATFKLEKRGAADEFLLTQKESFRVLGFRLTFLSEIDFRVCRTIFCSIAVPNELYEDFRRENGAYDYYVQLYRTPTVVLSDSSRNAPDVSNFHLVKEKKFVLEELFLPHILVLDDEISDDQLFSQLPLYTNPLQEGALQSNNLSPQYQTSLEKQGVFYSACIQRKEQKSLEVGNLIRFESEPVIETGVTAVKFEADGAPGSFFFSESTINITLDSVTNDRGRVITSDILSRLYFNNVDTYCLAIDLTLGRMLVLKRGAEIGPFVYEVFSVLENDFPINPSSITGTLQVFPIPLWIKESSEFFLGNYFNFTNFINSQNSKDFFYQNEIYSFVYRPLNLSPSQTPDWLEVDSPGSTFLNRSNFTLYFNDNSLSLDPSGVLIDASFLIERRNYLEYPTIFPAWSYSDSTETGFVLEEAKNQILYSKPFEPQAFPPLNFLTVGSAKNEIFALFKIRDSIIVLTTEGFFRLTGAVEEDFAITQIENEMIPLTRLLMTEQQDVVYALTQKGIVGCTESEASLIDAAVNNLLEKFLGLYRQNISAFTTKTCYTSKDSVLNTISFFMPSFSEKNIEKSTWGLTFDTKAQLFSTNDLFRDDNKNKNVLSLAYEPQTGDSSFYQTTSLEPFALVQKNKSITREDFLEEKLITTLNSSWQARVTASIGSSVVTLTCFQPHLLETGDFVKILSSVGPLDVKTYAVQVIDSLIFQVSLSEPSDQPLDFLTNFRFGRVDYFVGFLLEPEANRLRLSLSSFYENEDPFDPLTPVIPFNDFAPEVNDLIWIQKPWPSALQNALQNIADLEGARAIVETTSGSSPTDYFAFIELSQPSTNLTDVTGFLTFSYDTPARYRQQFSIVRPLSEPDFGVLFPFNDQLTFPFEFLKLSDDLIQGFLEKPIDSQMKLDGPVYIGTTAPITIMTSRITGGDPCSLKNFEQLVATFQNFFSCTRVQVSFQGDRFSAAAGVVWKAQQSLEGSFDPAFGDAIWSSVFEQWSTLTNPTTGWRQATPFVPLRLTVPNEVSQSTYLTVFLRHERPFESMSLGTIAINGAIIDPTSIGV